MYGKIFNANTDIRDNDPPENISNIPIIPLSPLNKCKTALALTPGYGMKEPIQYTISAPKVNMMRFCKSLRLPKIFFKNLMISIFCD